MELRQEQAGVSQGFGSASLLVPSSHVERGRGVQAGRDGTQPKSCPSPRCCGRSRSLALIVFRGEDGRGGSGGVAGPQPTRGWARPQSASRIPAEQQVSKKKPAHTSALRHAASRRPGLPQTSGLIRACDKRTARAPLVQSRGGGGWVSAALRAGGLTAAILFPANLQMIQHNKTYNSLLEKRKL